MMALENEKQGANLPGVKCWKCDEDPSEQITISLIELRPPWYLDHLAF